MGATLRLPTGPVRYYSEGQGAPTFFLVHGLPGGARDFRWISHLLARHGRVVRIDMPAFGETPRATMPSPTVEARGDFILDCLSGLGLKRPILVGHSMGGVVATMAASAAPERISGLALIASPGLRPHRALRRFPRGLATVVVRVPGVARLMRKSLARAYEQMGFRHTTHGERLHALDSVLHTRIPAHAERLRALQLPLFHAFCEDDPLVEVAITAQTAAELGGAVHRYADGKHNPQKHQAVELSAALGAWAATL